MQELIFIVIGGKQMDDVEELLTLIKNVMVDLVQIEDMLVTLQQKGSPENRDSSIKK